jgi:hypothetical protein
MRDMATQPELGSAQRAIGWAIAATRFATLTLAIAAISWGVVVYPAAWRQVSIERIAKRIIAGDPFKSEALAETAPGLKSAEEADCEPIALRSAAVIRLRVTEQAIATGEGNEIDGRLDTLRATLRRSLACTPSDAFLWVVLFWAENTRNGFEAENLKYLRMSYRLGPNEGWIALKRNRFALALFEELPPDLAEAAVSEFVKLVEDFVYDAPDIFTGPGWRLRDVLLPRLKDLPIRRRELFAKILYSKDLDISVPGVEQPGPRSRR